MNVHVLQSTNAKFIDTIGQKDYCTNCVLLVIFCGDNGSFSFASTFDILLFCFLHEIVLLFFFVMLFRTLCILHSQLFC